MKEGATECTTRGLGLFEHSASNGPPLSTVEICELASNGRMEEVEKVEERKGKRKDRQVLTAAMLK